MVNPGLYEDTITNSSDGYLANPSLETNVINNKLLTPVE